MIAGNGGSCSDSEHIVGELMKGFGKTPPWYRRTSLQALKAQTLRWGKLPESSRATSCHCTDRPWGIDYRLSNDVNGDMKLAQQLWICKKKRDVFWNYDFRNSKNVLYAATAKALEVTVIG